jgi:anion-transporting  ArsA/GET3 family ATPase
MTKEIHFVTGKGGVGKSLIAVAIALREAKKGRKTLLVELGEHSFYQDFFKTSAPVVYQPIPLFENLDVALWRGSESLREYALHLIKIESLTKLFFENSVSKSLIDIAPALPELAILGKITSGPRKHGPPVPYEVLVVDAFATGHFLALLSAPRGMAEAVRFGPMGEQSRAIDAVLRNPEICRTHVVTLPEEMPVKETEDLVEALQADFGIQPDLILNKMIDIPDLPKASTAETPFIHFLRVASDRQTEMRDRLEKLRLPLRSVPLLTEEDPVLLAELLAKELS